MDVLGSLRVADGVVSKEGLEAVLYLIVLELGIDHAILHGQVAVLSQGLAGSMSRPIVAFVE